MKHVKPGFHTPKHSGANGGCFDVAHNGDVVLLRDSKDKGTGIVLQYTRVEWQALIKSVGSDEWPSWVTPTEGGGVEVRMVDTPGGPCLRFTPAEVTAFTTSVRDGDPQMIGPSDS